MKRQRTTTIFGLAILASSLSPAFGNDDILNLLRRDDGGVGIKSAPVQTPSQAGEAELSQWSKPNWIVSRDNAPGLSAGASHADSGDQSFGFEAVLGWESEHVFRGMQEAKQTAVGGVEVHYGEAYGGVWANVPTADDFNSYQTRIDVYGGYGFDLGSSVYADIGVNGYIRPKTAAMFHEESSVEVYGGLSTGGPFSPAIYAYYDFVLERYTLEASAQYVLPFGQTDLVLGGTAGYSGGTGVDYAYAQGDVEVVYNLDKHTHIGLGGHVAVSSEPTFIEGLAITGDSSTWFGLRLRTGQ